MKLKKKHVIGFIVIALLLVWVLVPKKDTGNFTKKYAGAENLEADVKGTSESYTYLKYLADHSDAAYPENDVSISVTDFTKGEGAEVLQEFEGAQNVLSTAEQSDVEWQVTVPKAGMYNIFMEYYTVESRGVDIERKLYINGEMPFAGADALSFARRWTNKGDIVVDNQGNQIRPSQVDVPAWMDAYFEDDLGYFAEPYAFYFEEGVNTIRLEGVNEPTAIKSLTLRAIKEKPTYAQYKESAPDAAPSDVAGNYKQVIEGEDSTFRSSPSLYALYDRSSPATSPSSVATIKLNMIGGNAWRIAGNWIEWDFEVPEDNYYNITIKGRQNYNRGFVSNRAVYIDGEIPFSELNHISFQYSNKWENLTLSDKDNEPYQFYLTKGKHTIRMEVTLGDLGLILNEMSASVTNLNAVYRKILVLTGANPDRYRDYRIAKQYPQVIDEMTREYKRLYKMVDDIVAYSGQRSNQVAATLNLAKQLEKFVKNPDRISKEFVGFKNNISSLGTSILTLSEAPLDIDYITITGLNAKPDKVNESFLNRAVHEVKSFVATFTTDYNAVGDLHNSKEAIEVWMLAGRDQSTILKSMIDDTFTPKSGVKVNVKLVDPGILLNAVLAGKGPDVVLTVGQSDPVNYALRGAVEDLSQFPDLNEVLKSFDPSAYVPYGFQGGIYALPETQSFNVMFYRKDIMNQLGLEIPQTWDDLIAILPTIQQNNMQVIMPSTEGTMTNTTANLNGLLAFLYQNGGTIYDEEGITSQIDNENAVKAFDIYTKFFTQYKLPIVYDFPNLFRSGQCPLGIVDFGTFNQLAVFAPEIRGLWDFTLMPGTKKEDGTIDRSCNAGGVCTIMLKQDDEKTKQNAWTFMKWWVSTDAQVRFGQELESVMGAAARYATANVDAFEKLAWNRDQLDVLTEQRQWAVGYREIAGGYFTSRHMTNALRKINTQNLDVRETVLDYATLINEEIKKKRLEFGLDVR
jgi:ABC-type glycerol-3-phosphate transport system substrate-binding protein